tara:strand:- start:145 stop:405 length:261 start_codon:yes stop_codon:yes gene_type:complete
MNVYLVMRDGIEHGEHASVGYRLIGVYTDELIAQRAMANEESHTPSNSNDGWCGYYTMPIDKQWPGTIESEYDRPFNDVEWQRVIQ